MITALELENFKAFGERVRVEFAPITLIFGENSAGKSCILQALSLLKQTQESRQLAPLLLRSDRNGMVDLGSYQDVVFGHDVNRQLRIRVDMMASLNIDMMAILGKKVTVDPGLEITFGRSAQGEIRLTSLTLFDSATFRPYVRFEGREADSRNTEADPYVRTDIEKEPDWLRPMRGRTVAECVWTTDDHDCWARRYSYARSHAQELVGDFRRKKEDIQRRRESLPTEEEDVGSDVVLDSAVERAENAIRFYSGDFSLSEFIDRMREMELNALIGLSGLHFAGGGWRRPMFDVFPDEFGKKLGLDVIARACETIANLELCFRSLRPMGAYRQPPKRWYVSSGTHPDEVGYRGEMLPDILLRRPSFVNDVNEWLDRLEIGYHLKVQPIGDPSRELFEVRLIDRRQGGELDIAISDVGFGVSQILPFIVQSLIGCGQTLSIEQPEVHIHPRLQADLADLLVYAIHESEKQRFIIETHSEHLILRLLRRIRETHEGTLPEGHLGLKPEQLSVIYVERGEGGSKVRRLRIDEHGDFIDDWPGGFFPERLRELM